MDVKHRILENVRQQGVINGRLRQLQEDADRLNRDLQRLGGQIELLGDMLKEETGMNLNQLVDSDEEFKGRVAEASEAGNKLAEETTQKPQPSEELRSGTLRSSNKMMTPPEEPEPEVVRRREPHKIVVTDEPPTPDEDDEE